jgi:hypothetical protein
MLILGTEPEEPPEPPEDGLLLPQAARAKPAVKATERTAAVLVTAFK